MNQYRKVIWAEGIPLAQQHLQQWDHYHEYTLQTTMQAMAPSAWGLMDLVIDQDALANSLFRIKLCRAILADGRLIDFNGHHDGELSCAITNTTGDRVSIYLVLPNNRLATGITGYNSVGHAAWVADYQPTQDEYDGEREREVMFGRLQLLLTQEGEKYEKDLTIKVAELIAQGKGCYQLDRHYIPPIVYMQGGLNLMALMQRVQELMGAKRRALYERRENYSGNITDFGQTDLSHFMLLQELNRYYPLIHHFNLNHETHPMQLYYCLVSLLGVLSGFSERSLQFEPPAYRHDDLTQTFRQLEDRLREFISVVMPSTIRPLSLERKGETLYLATDLEAILFEKGTFFIACRIEHTDPVWVDQFQRQVKVGSIADIEPIVAAALPGIKLRHSQRPPKKLPVKLGYEYFYVEPSGDFWQHAKEQRSLAIFLPYELRQGQIELIHIDE